MTVLFAALWLPLGQQAFLAEHWMKIGTFAAPILVFMGFAARPAGAEPVGSDLKLLAVLMAAAYMTHQFEEHWVDALGRLYPLRDFLNQALSAAFGPEAASAMTPQAIFFINTSVVWLAAFLAIWGAPDHVFPALAMAGVIIVNGVAHIGQAIAAGAYNPGLITAILLFLPVSLAVFRAVWVNGQAGAIQIAAGIAWGFLAHVILIGGLLAANVHGLVPVALYYAALIAWAIVPSLVFRRAG
ncbi:MAG: HXXEE domain-containing protein [Pseudomonadota bacterium]